MGRNLHHLVLTYLSNQLVCVDVSCSFKVVQLTHGLGVSFPFMCTYFVFISVTNLGKATSIVPCKQGSCTEIKWPFRNCDIAWSVRRSIYDLQI